MPIVIKKKVGVNAAQVVVANDTRPVETAILSKTDRSKLIRALARQMAWRDHVESMKRQEGQV